MTEAEVDTRIELDNEIRELVGFAFEQYGEPGLDYVVTETAKFVESLKKELKR